MKKILIVTDTFPPYRHIGRFRIQGFSKHLKYFGCEPIILTPTASYLWDKDNRLVNEIPKTLKVFRAYLPPALPIIIRNFANRFRKKKKGGISEYNGTDDLSQNNLSILKRFLVSSINLYQAFLDKYILIPGQEILWIPFVIWKGIKIINHYDVDIIFSSAPVYTNHIVGYMLKVISRKKWVADYRDLWTYDYTRNERFGNARIRIERYIEKSIIRKADAIVCISPRMAEILTKEYNKINKVYIIQNGFDPTHINRYTLLYKKKSFLEIVYTGRMTAYRRNNLLLDSLGILLNDNPDIKNKLKLKFIGKVLSTEQMLIDEKIRKYSLENNIVFSGWINHSKCLESQKMADVLLLIIEDKKNSNAVLTGKLFEYIISDRPILALAPEGDAKDIIEETNTGIVVPPNNEEKIMQAIISYYEQWKANTLYINPNWNNINKYNRKNLTRKLAHLFNSFN